jgi:OFA family oxalate/formate antiporter-like MFS transporter
MKKHVNIPFAPSRIPVFYGWIIVAAGTMGMLMSIPGQTMGVSVFTENLLDDLTINRNNLSLAYLVGTVGSGLLITRAGKLYDRYGARLMGFIASAVLGLMLLYLTRVDALVVFFHDHANMVNTALTTFILMSFGFWGIRFFGQGLLTMVSRNMVMKWFNKKRGLANGIMGVFAAFGFSLAPKILNQFIEDFEWKGTWLLLGVIIGIGFVSFVLVFFRDNPWDAGLVADGKRIANKSSKRPPSLPPRDYTLSEARKTRAFWLFTLAQMISALYISGLTFHVVSVFDSVGMDKSAAISIFVPASIIAITVQFIASSISDYIRLKYLLMVFLLGMVSTTSALMFLGESSLSYWMLISGNGVTWGLYIVLAAVTWPRFFGLKNLGAISGFSLSWLVIGSAFGPYLFSLAFYLSGTYEMVAQACLAISIILFILSFRANNPSES